MHWSYIFLALTHWNIHNRHPLVIRRMRYEVFLHDQPCKSLICSKLDISIQVIALQLSCYCDVISNRLWRHQQNKDQASETRGQCVKIFVFIIIYVVVITCKKYDNVCTLVMNCFCAHLTAILCLFPSLLCKWESKHKNDPLVSVETVRHSSTYIILYILWVQN